MHGVRSGPVLYGVAVGLAGSGRWQSPQPQSPHSAPQQTTAGPVLRCVYTPAATEGASCTPLRACVVMPALTNRRPRLPVAPAATKAPDRLVWSAAAVKDAPTQAVRSRTRDQSGCYLSGMVTAPAGVYASVARRRSRKDARPSPPVPRDQAPPHLDAEVNQLGLIQPERQQPHQAGAKAGPSMLAPPPPKHTHRRPSTPHSPPPTCTNPQREGRASPPSA